MDGRQEAHLVAIAYSDAPEGHTHWTLQLLADKVVAMGFAESISLETVRQTLKKRTQTVDEEGVLCLPINTKEYGSHGQSIWMR